MKIKDDDTPEDIARKEYNRELVVSRKPYFMRYVYADVMQSWRNFVRKANDNCLRAYRMTVDELREMCDVGDPTAEQAEFMRNYDEYLPVSDGKCVVNRICHYIEDEFEVQPRQVGSFDHSILKSDKAYTESQYGILSRLYKDYRNDHQLLLNECRRKRIDADETKLRRASLREYYIGRCYEVCSNGEQLCNALVDICYTASTGKQFAWDVCGDQMVKNVLSHGDGKLHYPVYDPDGTIVYKGKHYTMKDVEAGNNDNT